MSRLRNVSFVALLLSAAAFLLLTQNRTAINSVNAQSKTAPVGDNLIITQSTTLTPGVYQVSDPGEDGVIQIHADNITLDGTGVSLVGDGKGYGISMNGHTGLTLQNFNVSGYRYGVRISNASNVLIQNSNISGNYKDTTTSFLAIELDETYGGGILFNNVSFSTVQHNTLTNQSTGLEMIASNNNRVLNNVTSSGPELNESGQNSCWGVRLSGSSSNLVRGTIADYVDRRRYGFESGDSAGILLVSGSNSNRIISNSLTHSGDGFFIGNTCGRASNNNYVYGNDGSFSPHNAFECTFSGGNVFEKNTANNSDYGFWLGYSHETRLIGNEINDNVSAGIAVEHGRNNEFDRNTISRNQLGIRLWADDNNCPWPDCGTACPSSDYRIHHNNITLNTRGLSIENSTNVAVSRNQISNNVSQNVYFSGASSNVTVAHNNLACQNTIAVSENLAYGKQATASSNAATAARAVDGIVFDPASSWVPDNPLGTGGYWQVDLGAASSLSEFVIYPYYINLGDFPLRFHIDVSTTGAFAGEQVRVVTETARPIKQAIVYDFAPASARYIRLVSDDPPRNWIQMMEFAAFSQQGHYPVQCQYAAYNDMAAGRDVPAQRNWWGTTSPSAIDALIYDHNDDPGKGYVFYNPFLPSPIPTNSGASGPGVGQWATTTPLPQASTAPFIDRGQQLIFHNNHIYVFGGHGADNVPQTGVYYAALLPDGTTGPWTATTPLPGAFNDQVVLRVGNRVYLITGAAGATAVYYASILSNGSLSSWTSTAPLSPSRQSFAAVAYGNYLYAAGGNSGGLQSFVKYSSVGAGGALNAWANTTPLPEPMQSHTMAAYDGFLYVFAPNGHVYYAPVNVDGTLGAWAATTSLPQAMSKYSTFEEDGFIYLIGGSSPGVYYAPIRDDGTLGLWQLTTNMPEQINNLRVGASNGYVYALGGNNAGGYKNTVYYAQLTVPVGCQGGEVVMAPFTGGLGGGVSSLTYRGFDTVTVTGVGQASGTNYSDAFYIFADGNGNPITPQHYASQYNWTLAINSQPAESFIPGQQVPAYRPDHRYTFRINAPGSPLTFGVGDGYGPDNSGRYVIGLCGGTP
ncbi:MAG: right-handed parallel beta-helix repeat-containing protein [Acidobacteria bacterium]|nr:right-handed parallel beta-helix repeat-containing protein [Acidobacteriota bacterium]